MVDPKGVEQASYQKKVDGFEKLFLKGNKNKKFFYKNFTITFDLILITKDLNNIGEKYRKYWQNYEGFLEKLKK